MRINLLRILLFKISGSTSTIALNREASSDYYLRNMINSACGLRVYFCLCSSIVLFHSSSLFIS